MKIKHFSEINLRSVINFQNEFRFISYNWVFFIKGFEYQTRLLKLERQF